MPSISQIAGSFWSEFAEDSAFSCLISARELVEQQTEVDFQTLVSCAGRATVPLYRRVLLQPVALRWTAKGDGFTWHIADNFRIVSVITDKITTPNTVWLVKIDYTIKDGCITFRNNPFEASFEQTAVYDVHGNVVDTEVTVWLHNADYDEGYLNDMWGAAVGLNAPSSEQYRALLNILYDAMISGTSREHVEKVVSVFSGVPLAQEDETVVELATDSKGFFLATDKHIYRSAQNGLPIVAIGQHVKAGDPLFDTVRFYRATDGISTEILPALTVPKSFLDAAIGTALTFPNREVPLINTNNRIEFEIGGQSEVVKVFWDLFNSKKTDQGYFLSELMAGQTHVNPCQFVRQNVLRNNCILCVIRGNALQPALAGIELSHLLRLIVPPHEALLLAS